MRRRLHSAAALAVVAFVATGCGGVGSTPTTPPPLTTSGIASTSPASGDGGSTPSPTVTSPIASASSTPGTTAGGRHPGSGSDRSAAQGVLATFLGGLDAAAAAKSTAALKPLYAASCLWCADQTKSIDLAAFLKGSRTGGVVSGTSIKYHGVGREKQLVFDVTMSVSAMKVVDGNGHTQLSAPAVAHGAFTFGVAESAGGWTVVDGSQGRKSL